MARLATFYSVSDMVAHWTDPANADKFNNSFRWNRKTRTEYRARIMLVQGGLCVMCGTDMVEIPESNHAAGCECGDVACHGVMCRCEVCDMSAEFSHTVPATFHGKSRRGWLVTNVSLWHRRCNRLNGERVASGMVRPDLMH